MPTRGLLDLALIIIDILDELGVPYALGGSLASSVLGEPRSTMDVDLAVRLDESRGEALLDRVGDAFYVPLDAAREAIRTHSSFNLVDTANGLKADLFVVGDDVLDRMQIERRVLMPLPGAPHGIWVTSAEDQVLRKLDWFRLTGSTSERQWRDVVGILRVHRGSMDLDYLMASAAEVGLSDELDGAVRQSEGLDHRR